MVTLDQYLGVERLKQYVRDKMIVGTEALVYIVGAHLFVNSIVPLTPIFVVQKHRVPVLERSA